MDVESGVAEGQYSVAVGRCNGSDSTINSNGIDFVDLIRVERVEWTDLDLRCKVSDFFLDNVSASFFDESSDASLENNSGDSLVEKPDPEEIVLGDGPRLCRDFTDDSGVNVNLG